MKKAKYLIAIIMLLIININIIGAKTANDVVCFYTIKNTANETMTTAQVQIIGYNDGSGGRVVVFFKNENGEYVNYADTGPTYDWQNYDKIDAYSTSMLRFFTTDKKGTTFISNYKTSGKCPVIYTNVSADGSTVDVENHVLDPTNPTATSKSLSATEERLRENGGDWINKNDFYKDENGETTVKEDLVCSYDMEFDMYNIKTPVEFRTMYNPSNGNKTYRISVNGNGQTFSDLNTDIALSLGQGGSDLVYITSTQLKKIFKDGSCYERSKVYHYYDLSSSKYIITTDQKEASENGVAGRYDNGDGSNDNAGGTLTAPDFDISEEPMTCEELLGSAKHLIRLFIVAVRIAAVIIAIVISMLNFIPPIMNGNPDGELQKALKKTAKLYFILVIVVGFPNILNIIGQLFELDLSCVI